MHLTVKQLTNRDPGSGMAVIDRDALRELGVSSGDFVAIEGRDGGRFEGVDDVRLTVPPVYR